MLFVVRCTLDIFQKSNRMIDAFVDYFSIYSCCNLCMSICTRLCLTLFFTPNFSTFNTSVKKQVNLYVHSLYRFRLAS